MLAAGQFCPACKVENTHLKDYRTATKTNMLTAVSDVTAGQTAQRLVSKPGRVTGVSEKDSWRGL